LTKTPPISGHAPLSGHCISSISFLLEIEQQGANNTMSKRIQGIIIGVIITTLLFGGIASALVGTKNISVLYRDIRIVVDGYTIAPKDANGKPVEPFIFEGTTYLPVRAVSEALGKSVEWDGHSNTVYIGEKPQDGAEAGAHGIRIAISTMDSIDQHWLALYEGAQKAAMELGVEVRFISPHKPHESQQIERINEVVAAGFDAIVVAPIGPDSISGALSHAIYRGLKIIYVDSPANVPAEATFSTDNKAAGRIAGDQMLTALQAAGVSSGKIGIVNVNAMTDSVVRREAGFREAFAGSGFDILETQYGEGDFAKSQPIAENYITQGVVGIFGANEGSTVGAGNAIKSAGNHDIVGVGFDKSDAIINLISDGWLHCSMAQNPDVMGYEGVKAAVAAINGQSLGGAVIDTGVTVLKG